MGAGGGGWWGGGVREEKPVQFSLTMVKANENFNAICGGHYFMCLTSVFKLRQEARSTSLSDLTSFFFKRLLL